MNSPLPVSPSPHASDFSHLGRGRILGPPEINMVCCLEVHRPSEGDAESRFRPPSPPYRFPVSICHHWPTPPPPPALLCPWLPAPGLGEAVGRSGGGQGGHGWCWEQMAGRVTSVARLSGPIIPPDGPPALLLFPAPGRPGLPRQRRPAATWGCPGRRRAALSPHLLLLLLACPGQRELDLCIPVP